MTIITTRLIVTPEGAVSTALPLPAGEHLASIELREQPATRHPALPFDVDALPLRSLGPWPSGMSLRREELYGDAGR